VGAYDLLQEVHGCRVRRIDVERDLERRDYRRVAAMALDSYSSAQCEHSSPVKLKPISDHRPDVPKRDGTAWGSDAGN
jgi:hypothetical protein